MLFLRFPASLPFIKQSSSGKGKEVVDSNLGSSEKVGGHLENMPAGFVGKMQVYKSGVVKLKLGGTLFYVSPGVKCDMLQHAAAVNAKEKHYCELGKIEETTVDGTPDIDSLELTDRKRKKSP